jgi:hypothetical protein
MGTIFEFPSQQVQGLAYLDRQLRNLLQSRGADLALTDFAATQLTQIYARLSTAQPHTFSLRLPSGMNPVEKEELSRQIDVQLEGVRQENHALMVKMVAQLVLAEVRLYQLERANTDKG